MSNSEQAEKKASKADQTVECENCGQQRYTFEACQHCDYIHWEDE